MLSCTDWGFLTFFRRLLLESLRASSAHAAMPILLCLCRCLSLNLRNTACWRDATPPLLDVDVVVVDVVVEAFYDATRVNSVIAFFEEFVREGGQQVEPS